LSYPLISLKHGRKGGPGQRTSNCAIAVVSSIPISMVLHLWWFAQRLRHIGANAPHIPQSPISPGDCYNTRTLLYFRDLSLLQADASPVSPFDDLRAQSAQELQERVIIASMFHTVTAVHLSNTRNHIDTSPDFQKGLVVG
jgi:hypothetical protein